MRQQEVFLKNISEYVAKQTNTNCIMIKNFYNSKYEVHFYMEDKKYLGTMFIKEGRFAYMKTLNGRLGRDEADFYSIKEFCSELFSIISTDELMVFAEYTLPSFATINDWEALKELPNRTNEGHEKPRIFFDLDGTCAKWNAEATIEQVFTKGYYRNLEENKSIVDTAKALSDAGYDIYILSQSPFSGIQDKIEWVNEHMPFVPISNIVIVPFSQTPVDKTMFISDFGKNDYLVDDYSPNIEKWEMAGGTPIHCLNEINSFDKFHTNIDTTLSPLTNAKAIDILIQNNLQKQQFELDNFELEDDEYEL